jgi:hypothetical protein
MKHKIIMLFCIIGFICTFSSCCDKVGEKNRNLIIGEWKQDAVIDITIKDEIDTGDFPPPPRFSGYGRNTYYQFFENGKCEIRDGFFKYSNKHIRFLGNETEFKINKNNLQIFNPSDSTWTKFKIISISSDTLLLLDKDSLCYKFSHFNYKINTDESYEAIVLSSTYCYGTCPVRKIWVSRTGEVVYYGIEYNSINGLFSGKITEDEYVKIENAFKKCNILEMEDFYHSNWTDDQTITVSFIKDNKIIKSIEDYGRVSPQAFRWAYMSLLFLPDKLQLTPLDSTDVFNGIYDKHY